LKINVPGSLCLETLIERRGEDSIKGNARSSQEERLYKKADPPGMGFIKQQANSTKEKERLRCVESWSIRSLRAA